MDEKQVILNNVYEQLQKLTIPATSENINIVVFCLNSLKEVYNLICTEKQHGENADGTISGNG